LEKGRLALFLLLVPLILQTKNQFWGSLGVDNAPFVAGIDSICHTKEVQMGSIRPILRPSFSLFQLPLALASG
jgi:hypothetical protein